MPADNNLSRWTDKENNNVRGTKEQAFSFALVAPIYSAEFVVRATCLTGSVYL